MNRVHAGNYCVESENSPTQEGQMKESPNKVAFIPLPWVRNAAHFASKGEKMVCFSYPRVITDPRGPLANRQSARLVKAA